MSQRLTLPLGNDHPIMRRRRIVGWNKHGAPIWLPMGGDGSDDDKDADKGTGGDKDADKDKGADGDKDDADKDKDKDDPDKTPVSGTVSAEDHNRTVERMKAADRRASEAEDKLRKAEDKDKSELEVAKRDLTEAKATIEERDKLIRDQAVRLAFLTAGANITWHDPDDALLHAMRDERVKDLKLDDEGGVDKTVLGKVVKDLAKSKPYLVKSGDDDDKDKDDKDDKDKDDTPTGGQPGGGKDKNTPDRAKMSRKYPALAR